MEWPYVEGILWDTVAQSPCSPELGALGVSPVWVVCALRLQLNLIAMAHQWVG